LGGSDVAGLFGKSPWKSIHEIWLAKTQEADDEQPEMQVHQELGLEKEPGLIRMYLRRRPGITVQAAPELIRHPVHSFMIGHLDGLICDLDGKPVGVLEIKTAGYQKAWQWGSEETDEVPEDYNLQVHHYMAITGLPYAEIAVEIAGYQFRIYRVNRNEELINIIIDRCKDFWENYVIPRVPPPIDGSRGAAKMLSALYPDSEEREILADENINKICLAYFETRRKMADLEAEEMAGANQIKELMKDAGYLSGLGYKIAWKTSKEGVKVDYKGIVGELKPSPELVAKYSETKPGNRVFRPGKLRQEQK
jgi:putative phage-type endonuclease